MFIIKKIIDKKILLIDQSETLCDFLSEELLKHELKIETARSLDKAFNIILSTKYDLIISNLDFSGDECIKMLKVFYHELPVVPVILITKSDRLNLIFESSNDNEKSIYEGINNCLDIDKLANQVKQLLIADENIREKYNFLLPLHNGFEKNMTLNSAEKIINYAPTFLIKDLVSLGYLTIEETFPLKTSLVELLSNALYHGNFEIDSDVRNSGSFEGQKVFKKQVLEKENTKEFYEKKIKLNLSLSSDYTLSISIEDEGVGFDWKSKVDTTVKGLMFSGKGLLLAKALVDDMKFNDKGNKVTIYKKLNKENR